MRVIIPLINRRPWTCGTSRVGSAVSIMTCGVPVSFTLAFLLLLSLPHRIAIVSAVSVLSHLHSRLIEDRSRSSMPPLPKPRLTTEATDLLESLERRARFVQDDLIPRLNTLTLPSQYKDPGPSSSATSLHGHQRLSDEIREELGVLARDLDVSCYLPWEQEF